MVYYIIYLLKLVFLQAYFLTNISRKLDLGKKRIQWRKGYDPTGTDDIKLLTFPKTLTEITKSKRGKRLHYNKTQRVWNGREMEFVHEDVTVYHWKGRNLLYWASCSWEWGVMTQLCLESGCEGLLQLPRYNV